jgi:hypothetical protein
MFRSLANLISHKRSFCKSRQKNVQHIYQDGEDDISTVKPDKIVVVQPEPIETVFPEAGFELQDYSPSIEFLKEAGIMAEIEEKPLIDSLLPSQHSRSKLDSIVKMMRAKQESKAPDHDELLLEPLTQTSKAVFQVISIT